jgi:hypothetical protein
MNKTSLLKIGKTVIKASLGVLKFSAKIAWNIFLSNSSDAKKSRKWLDDYDEYSKAITHKEPFY